MMRDIEIKRVCYGLGVACVHALSQAPTAFAQQAQEPATLTEETIVIGEKVERSLKETTSSVSVIDKDALQSMQNITLSNTVAEVPNVVSLSGAVPDIRGVSGNGSAGGFNSISGGARGRVSILTDGVAEPFVADFTGDSGLWDIEQVEVYRGPQSTNNGRNSIAGSIFIKTKDPSNEWEGAARLGYRNQESFIDTSGVISGPIVEDTLAFRLSLQQINGQTITNEEGFPGNPPGYDLNEIKTTKSRTKFLLTPTENFSVMLSHSTNNERGDAGRVYYKAENIEERNRLFFRNIETDSNTTSLDFGFSLSDTMSFDVLLAVMDYQWGFDSYEETPEAEQQLSFDENNTTFDSRFNFGSSDGVNGFFGLSYFEREQDILSEGAFVYFGDDESESQAIYGETSFKLNSQFILTAGGRWQRESQLRDFSFGAINAQLDQSRTFLLPKLVLQYLVSDETTLAISARKGYNAAGGALNFTAQEYYFYDEEQVNTLEFSTRSHLAGDKIFLSSNVFYNVYDGYQALSSTRFIVNMDEVVTYGAELELAATLNAYVELNVGLGLLASEITDPSDEFPEVEGNELNSAPAYTANVGAKYLFNEDFDVGIFVNYIGEYFGDFVNTEERIAGDYTLLRLSANFAMNNWRVTGFINNALDEDAFVAQDPGSPRQEAYFAIVTPRTIGASVTYSF